jgi:hypothetical protein
VIVFRVDYSNRSSIVFEEMFRTEVLSPHNQPEIPFQAFATPSSILIFGTWGYGDSKAAVYGQISLTSPTTILALNIAALTLDQSMVELLTSA